MLNFEDIDVDGIIRLWRFYQGNFCCDGRIEEISPKIFLFARSQDFKDGTLKTLLMSIKVNLTVMWTR